MEVNSLNDRVREVFKYSNLNNNQLAYRIGVAASTIGDIIKGEKGAGKKVIEGISLNFPQVNSLWLISGIGNMLIQDSTISALKTENTIPYYPEVNASAGMDFLTNNGHNYSLPIKIPNVDAQAFINVFGDSMYPKFCSGEIIGIKEIQKDMVFFGHAYVIQMIDDEAYIKYIDQGKDDEHWILRSENPNYQPKQFHLSKIVKVYIIKAVISKSTLL